MKNTTIDPAILRSIGIVLDPAAEAELVDTLQQVLEERIGLAIIELLDENAATELDKLTDEGNQAKVSEWIATHVPDYQQIVRDEYDILMGEVAEDADKFMPHA
jgi:hypothetical protein